jgi:hypothetical protein
MKSQVLSTVSVGIIFTGLGLVKRQQGKAWIVFFVAGITALVVAILFSLLKFAE